MLTIDDISKDILRVPTLGVIPECPSVLQASNEGKPVILYSETKAGQGMMIWLHASLAKTVLIDTSQLNLKAG